MSSLHLGNHQVGGTYAAQRQGSVENVGRREPHVEHARRRPDLLLDGLEKGDDVVSRATLDLRHPLGVGRLGPAHLGHRVFRDLAKLGHRLGGGKLHFEPRGVLRRLVPKPAHFRAGIAADHRGMRRLSVGCRKDGPKRRQNDILSRSRGAANQFDGRESRAAGKQ